MKTSSFRGTSEAILDEVLSWEPSYATQLGYHKFDTYLPDWSANSIRHQTERMNEIIDEMRKIDESSLTGEESIDRDLAIHLLRMRLFELTELRMHEKASMAAKEIGDSLFFLYSREHPLLEKRLHAMTSRLEGIPEFLDESRKLIKTPYRLWNEIQHETGERLPRLFNEIQTMCEERSEDKDALSKLNNAVKDAAAAIQEHNVWLMREIIPSSSEKAAFGSDLYRRYLIMKGFGVDADEILSMAETHLEDVNKKKAAISKMIVPSGRAYDALNKMRCDHHETSKEILDEYRDSILKARDFILRKELASVPNGEELHVMETPYFMRHVLAYAAQYEPGKFDNDMNGIFLVTPDDGNPALLEEHSHAAIVNTSVHEGYPGHHLHGVCMNTHPSLIRPLYQSSDFAEGWALYCEDLMLSQGYNDNPLGRLTILNDLAFRIARQICDVKLSMDVMSVEQAAELISAQTQTHMSAAMSEAKAIMMCPTYFSSYFVGKLGVMQLRESVQKTLGSKFSLGFFHDALIYSGCMPMPFMRRAVALKVKDKYGKDLHRPSESLYEYSNRILSGSVS